MLNKKKLDRLFAKYNINPADNEYLTMLFAAAKAKSEIDTEVPEWTHEELEDALHGRKALFAARSVTIPQSEFVSVFKQIRDAVRETADIPEAWEGMPEPEALFTEEMLAALARDPNALWELLEKVGVDLERAQIQLVPAAAFAMRVFFEDAAVDASGAMERLVPDTVHFSRSLNCPVCGMQATMAGVGATQNHGNVKSLYCACCGSHWQFERIRCAVCGTEAASDLEYVHLHEDEKHRLHVCKACGSSVPTVFGSELDDFDPDIETWRCGELIVAYQDQQEKKAAEEKEKGAKA